MEWRGPLLRVHKHHDTGASIILFTKRPTIRTNTTVAYGKSFVG